MHNANFHEAATDTNLTETNQTGDVGWHSDRAAQDASLSKFKFMFAFENNLCEHYLTEKVWKALALGTVPVVMAGSRALEALPADDAYINVAHFQTAVELREYLHRVANDGALYMSYFEWRTRPFTELSPSFQILWQDQVLNLHEGTMCCTARGVYMALNDFQAGMLPPPIPGLACKRAEDWDRFLTAEPIKATNTRCVWRHCTPCLYDTQ
jgi:hypothetical protein